MNRKLVLNNELRVIGKVDFQSTNDATSCTDANAALRVAGGVAIGKKLFVCGDVDFGSNIQVDGTSTFDGKLNVNADIDMRDNDKLLLGNDDDLQIYHNGSNSYIKDGGTGALVVNTNSFNVKNAADSQWMIEALEGNNGVKLYHSGLIKFETLSGGAIVRGDLEVTEDLQVNDNVQINDNLNVDGTTTLNNTTVDGVLDVNGSATIDNVTINGDTVTATTFNGTATKANDIRVDGLGDSNGPHYLLLQNGTNAGHYTRAKVDSGIKYNSSSNTLSLNGDIIAFASDDRLKTNKVELTGALDKVCSLNGFTFNFNETAGELGFPTDVTYVGVSAQEVQEVLPEAVQPAPVDSEYITVQYEKIVPLLIEAIKELSDKVSALEDKLNN